METLLAAVLIPLGLWLGQGGTQKALLLGPVVLVLVAELLNTAIEKAVDLTVREQSEVAALAKDSGSAAVFLCLCLVPVVWALVLFF